jgi:GTPase SAR1 family protein
MVIVGNKSDLKTEQRQVTTSEGQKLAEQFKCSFTEASARFNTNVTEAFTLVISEIEKSQNPNEPTGGGKCEVM